MELLIIVLSCCIAAASVGALDISIEEEWNMFKHTYGKNYTNETEENFRMKIFLDNKDKIEKHNLKHTKGLVSFTLGLNKYADLMYDEFYTLVNGYNLSLEMNQYMEMMPEEGIDYVSLSNTTLPKSVNWTELGAVTPVKEQGYCGSCWAFSAIGALEGQHFLHNGILTSLSVQNVMDCSKNYGNTGCTGGFTRQAYRYIKYNSGINTEEVYPYKGVDGTTCNFDKSKIEATDRGYVNLPQGDEAIMMEAVATVGPLAVVIDVNRESLQFYKNGVFNEPECHSGVEYGRHAVLCVGYGSEENGAEYWLVKNSWGSTWGDGGFIKMSRNKDNQCGIANDVSYPLV
ncbi:cathepsin L-like isoform X2 [Episyrphus balteatus]|uniref:cathepsin L-like isoform X2 n=1 Tax=Episyrphus balteatus TaxID=286459 RepID=UPI00248650BB|nr:cathepsin L-like isoform X2 [Episyrphus balteatus]